MVFKVTVIIISGSPGTGKTSVAKLLSKELNYKLIKINEFAKEKNLITGKDKKRNSDIVDTLKLKKEISRLKGNFVIEGHLAHFAKGDFCIILRTNPKELEKRLRNKKWDSSKIKENVEAELIDLILQEALQINKNVYEIDTTNKKPKEIVKKIKKILNGIKESHLPGKINWMNFLF